jgi:general secretion pathway protein G
MTSNVNMDRSLHTVLALLVLAALSGCSNRNEKEAELKRDLSTIREAIDRYTMEKHEAPQSLQDLVNEHYLHNIPSDPLTDKRDWVPVTSDTVLTVDQTKTGIADVHSNSSDVDRHGIPYNTW